MAHIRDVRIVEIKEGGKLVAYDLITEFRISQLSSLILVKEGTDGPTFLRSVDDHMESLRIRLQDFTKEIIRKNTDAITIMLERDVLQEKRDRIKASNEMFMKNFRGSTYIKQSMKKIMTGIIDGLDENLPGTLIIRKLLKLTYNEFVNDNDNFDDDDLADINDYPDDLADINDYPDDSSGSSSGSTDVNLDNKNNTAD